MRKSAALIFLLGVMLSACKKEPATVSKVVTVTHPTINLTGPAYVHLSVGEAYSDPGATLIDDVTGNSSTISATSSDLDVNTTGMYSITFEAANANGFKTTAVRTILVLNYTPPAALDSNFDISGLYQRTNGIYVNLYKMDNGLYIIDNFAGSTLVFPAYLLTPDTTSIDIPAQISLGGFALDVNSETFSNTPPTTFSYRVDAAGFGTGVRTFIKQ
jgi:hypothetical protein